MKINKKALLLGTMAFVLVAASGMVSAYASGSSGTKKAKVQTITEGVCIGSVDVGGMTKEEAKKAVDAYVDSIKDTSFSLRVQIVHLIQQHRKCLFRRTLMQRRTRLFQCAMRVA